MSSQNGASETTAESVVNDLTDNELIDEIIRNPSAGMRILIDEYSSVVFGAVNSRLSGVCSYDEIEACVSLVFTEFYFHIKKFDSRKCSVKTFLCALARNKAIEEYRRATRYSLRVRQEDDLLLELPDSFDLQSLTERRISERQLLRAVDSLGNPDSRIIIRRYFYAQPSKQIAREMGMTDAAVRKRISRSLARLKQMLEDDDD